MRSKALGGGEDDGDEGASPRQTNILYCIDEVDNLVNLTG